MGLNTTLKGDRLHIAIFGKRNAGKSSIINALTGQNLAIVSDVKGTTTDPVSKAMELLPLGPCLITDTPGLDDVGELGKKRVEKAVQVLNSTDIAIVAVDMALISDEDLQGERGLSANEVQVISLIEEKKIPYIIVLNKSDCVNDAESVRKIKETIVSKNKGIAVNVLSTVTDEGIEELKDAVILISPDSDSKLHIVGDLIEKNDIVVLVTPIDEAAPKGRLIMPQQQVIRDILDNNAIAVVTQVPELYDVLKRLSGNVKMVITDSQAFKEVAAIVPESIPLTSFSILFARHKGNLSKLIEGVKAVEKLKNGDKVLIAEGCTHRRQCNDIGTVKIPRFLRNITDKIIEIETCSGTNFPQDLSIYSLIIHCGGCTLNEKEMKHRMHMADLAGVPMVNYGIFLAHVNGILERSIEVF